MCGRPSQYDGIHDFVAALSMLNALVNNTGDQPASDTTQLPLAGDFPSGRSVSARRHGPMGMASTLGEGHGAFLRAIWPHRAIIAINNWFEWVDEGGPKKQPYLIRHRDRSPILCAAIGQYPVNDREMNEHDGFVIITADSAGGMVDIHDRRPVVLSPQLAGEWLDQATPKERAEQMALLEGEPSEMFEWFQVDRAVGNVRNQSPHLIEPVGPNLFA